MEKKHLHIVNNEVDFIVSDLKMPTMDGLTLLKELNKALPILPPMLIISGYLTQDIRNEAIELGVLDLIFKPFDFERITKYLDN